jgi:hypothetical protein
MRRQGGAMKKRFIPFPQSDSIKWKDWDRKMFTIIQSKKPFERRMEVEMEEEKEEGNKSSQSSFPPRTNNKNISHTLPRRHIHLRIHPCQFHLRQRTVRFGVLEKPYISHASLFKDFNTLKLWDN